MRLVIDASVALDRCLAGDAGPLADHELHAPALLASEVASVLREMTHRGEITVTRATRAATVLETLGVVYAQPGSLVVPALELATRLGWAKTNDAEYVSLASRLACPLLSLDARLARGAAQVVQVFGPSDL